MQRPSPHILQHHSQHSAYIHRWVGRPPITSIRQCLRRPASTSSRVERHHLPHESNIRRQARCNTCYTKLQSPNSLVHSSRSLARKLPHLGVRSGRGGAQSGRGEYERGAGRGSCEDERASRGGGHGARAAEIYGVQSTGEEGVDRRWFEVADKAKGKGKRRPGEGRTMEAAVIGICQRQAKMV